MWLWLCHRPLSPLQIVVKVKWSSSLHILEDQMLGNDLRPSRNQKSNTFICVPTPSFVEGIDETVHKIEAIIFAWPAFPNEYVHSIRMLVLIQNFIKSRSGGCFNELFGNFLSEFFDCFSPRVSLCHRCRQFFNPGMMAVDVTTYFFECSSHGQYGRGDEVKLMLGEKHGWVNVSL